MNKENNLNNLRGEFDKWADNIRSGRTSLEDSRELQQMKEEIRRAQETRSKRELLLREDMPKIRRAIEGVEEES